MQRSLLPNPQSGGNAGGSFFMIAAMVALFMLSFNMMNNWRGKDQAAEKVPEKPPVKIQDPAEPLIKDDDSGSPAPDIPELASQDSQPVMLGSLDPESPYRMLVTLANRGASIVRVELNETNLYRDVQDLSGYLGQIVPLEVAEKGVTVQVVGKGTPAEKAGLIPGDRIIRLERTDAKKDRVPHEIEVFAELREALLQTKPNEEVDLTVVREGAETVLKVKLVNAPMSVLRPELTPGTYKEYRELGGLRGYNPVANDPLSFLCSINSFDNGEKLPWPQNVTENHGSVKTNLPRDESVDFELPGLDLRERNWEVASLSEDEVVFRTVIPAMRLEVLKKYRLAKKFDQKIGLVGEEEGKDRFAATAKSGYHLVVSIELKNLDSRPHTLAYELDGPTGLPVEGAWYGRKNGPRWRGGYGLRDVIVQYNNAPLDIIPNYEISRDMPKPWGEGSLKLLGVDTRYFQCTLLPNLPNNTSIWHAKAAPMRVGSKDIDWITMTDVSWRLVSKETQLAPAGEDGSSLLHEYTVFVGPKEREVLLNYELEDTLYAGWFWFVSLPMLYILHTLHWFLGSYAVSIIFLTIIVRFLMYPLSRKQAIGTMKMAEIQPELEKLKEKYAKDTEGLVKAQQELWKKHNYNPLSGCLPMFIQLPIFIGLYNALSIDVALYGAPLISENFRWCSDLSAPDMLYDWSAFWTSMGWERFNTGQGRGFTALLTLGPYFNLLPMLTFGLILLHQQMVMPPPTDDQQKTQRRMMNFMMIFMGFIFFRVPSGLCVYFIASSLFGILERRFIPKPQPKTDGVADEIIDVKLAKSEKSDRKSSSKSSSEDSQPKTGILGKLTEILEKAAEKPGLEKSDKQNKKKRKK